MITAFMSDLGQRIVAGQRKRKHRGLHYTFIGGRIVGRNHMQDPESAENEGSRTER